MSGARPEEYAVPVRKVPEETVVLRDGGRIYIRPIQPSDRPLFEGQMPASIFRTSLQHTW